MFIFEKVWNKCKQNFRGSKIILLSSFEGIMSLINRTRVLVVGIVMFKTRWRNNNGNVFLK